MLKETKLNRLFGFGDITMRSTFTAGLFLMLLLATSAEAVVVQVNWSASIPGTTTPAPGPGQLSGSLGVFNVNAAGDTFLLPSDGSLTVLASGFADGFPNGTYSLTRATSPAALTLEFLTIGTTAADFSVGFVNNNGGLLSPFPSSCTVDATNGYCFVALFDESGGRDIALASLGISGSLDDENIAPISYEFSVVPLPAAAWLFGTALIGLIGFSKRRKAA